MKKKGLCKTTVKRGQSSRPLAILTSLHRAGPAGFVFLILIVLFLGNVLRHIWHQPVEILAHIPIENRKKTPEQIWRLYQTELLEAQLLPYADADTLAALMGIESHGDPWARPPWTLKWRGHFLDFFAPETTAFGALQITKGTFERGLRLVGSKVNEKPSWLYTRASVRDSLKVAASVISEDLDALKIHPRSKRRPEAAAVAHLCGRQKVSHWLQGELTHCGSHRVRGYLNRFLRLRKTFQRLRTEGDTNGIL